VKRIQRKVKLIAGPRNADGVAIVFSDTPSGATRAQCPNCKELVNATPESANSRRLRCPRCNALFGSVEF